MATSRTVTSARLRRRRRRCLGASIENRLGKFTISSKASANGIDHDEHKSPSRSILSVQI